MSSVSEPTQRLADYVLGDRYRLDAMNEFDALKQLVHKVDPDTRVERKSLAYLQARRDAILGEEPAPKSRTTQDLADTYSKLYREGGGFTGSAPRDDRREDRSDSPRISGAAQARQDMIDRNVQRGGGRRGDVPPRPAPRNDGPGSPPQTAAAQARQDMVERHRRRGDPAERQRHDDAQAQPAPADHGREAPSEPRSDAPPDAAAARREMLERNRRRGRPADERRSDDTRDEPPVNVSLDGHAPHIKGS